MGHAGAWAAPGENLAEDKYKALESAGATMVDHPEKFGNVIKGLLSQAGKDVNKIVSRRLIQGCCNVPLIINSKNRPLQTNVEECI